MGIDFQTETPIRASWLATRIGARPTTVTRWILHGLRIPGRKGRVKLRGEKVGSRWTTSEEAYEEFRRLVNRGRQTAPLRSPTQKRSAAAGRRLQELGI